MAAPNKNTFDLVPPRRPGKSDFNDIQKTDDAKYPPNVRTQPNAAEWNTMEWLLVAIGRVMPACVISVVSGAIVMFSSAGSNVTQVTFTPNVVSAGVVEITWPANTFPPAIAKPVAFLNGSVAGMITCEEITNGIRVRTFNSSGVATTLSFTAHVY